MSTVPDLIYLDNNATTRVDPAVLEAMLPWLGSEFGNPSSGYELGRRSAAALEEARSSVAALIGAKESEILFTSCGTESINSAILSCARLDPDKKHIITSTVEHSATVKLCEYLAMQGYEITWLPVAADGTLDPQSVREAITDETALISLLWANNETGVLFPVEEIAAIAAEKRVALHIDAVQAAGKLPIDLARVPVHFLSLSGHKLHCPKGVGALYINRRIKFTPLLRGSQEDGRRGGTQNVASIVAFGRAAALAIESPCADHVRGLRDQFENEILRSVPGTMVNGHREFRLPNTSNISFEGVESEGALLLMAARGLCCSAGSACTTGSVHPSHVLRAMGLGNDRARSSLRFSFGRMNTLADVEAACRIVPEAVQKLREMRPSGEPVLS